MAPWYFSGRSEPVLPRTLVCLQPWVSGPYLSNRAPHHQNMVSAQIREIVELTYTCQRRLCGAEREKYLKITSLINNC